MVKVSGVIIEVAVVTVATWPPPHQVLQGPAQLIDTHTDSIINIKAQVDCL